MRPKYGDVFRFDRLFNVLFYTSNTEKLIQARLIFMRSDTSFAIIEVDTNLMRKTIR